MPTAIATREYCLGSVTQIPLGEGRAFVVAGRRIAVFRTRTGGVYATQADCPHRSGPLADGLLGGDVLVCPLHAWKFDLRTGEALFGSCGLTTYPVRVSQTGELFLMVDGERHRCQDNLKALEDPGGVIF